MEQPFRQSTFLPGTVEPLRVTVICPLTTPFFGILLVPPGELVTHSWLPMDFR